MCVGYENECSGCPECNPKPKSHPHAELMAMYAEDAKETDKPWERWEFRNIYVAHKWTPTDTHPNWAHKIQYRRKPKTININGFEVPEPIKWDGYTEPDLNWYVVCLAFKNEIVKVSEYHNVMGGLGGILIALKQGRVHTTRDAAELHAKALLSFTEKG